MLSPDPTGRLGDVYTPSQHEPTASEDQLCADIRDFTRRCDEQRSRLLRVWEVITSYVRGDQHLHQNEHGELVKVRRKSKRLESTNNQLLLAERQLHAKLAKFMPDFEAEPSTGDQDEMQGALAASSFIQYFRYKEDFNIKFLLSLHNVAREGMGLHMLEFNPEGGRRLAICPVCNFTDDDDLHVGEECPACKINNAYEAQEYQQAQVNAEEVALRGGQPVPLPEPPVPEVGILEPIAEGDLEIVHIHPKEFYPEPGVVDIKHMGQWAIRRPRPVQDVRERWPKYADVIAPKPGIYSFNNIKHAHYSSSGHFQYDDFRDHCIETYWFQKPSAGYPRGRMVVTINDHICVHDGENPLYFIGRPNVFVYPWGRDTESFWPQPFGEHAWHRQKELNENERQQRENSELLSNGKLIIYRNSGVRPDQVSATTGQVIPVLPNMPPPQYLRGPELPQSAWQRGGIVRGSIFEQASIGIAEQGVMSGDISGRALAIVQAEADQQLGPTFQYIWAEVAELFKSAIMAARVFYSSDKQFHINGEMGLQVFTLADMEMWQGRDLRVVPEDGLSKNQQLRLQSIMNLANLGLFSNQQTGLLDVPRFVRAAKLRIAGIGGDKTQAQRTHAHYMLRQIEQFDFSQQPKPWDDPITHAAVFLHWLQTKGYNPKTDPMVVMHVQNLFSFYTAMSNYLQGGGAPPTPPAPGPNQSQQAQQAQLGDGMGPGGQNAGAQSPAMQQAQNSVQQADGMAEAQARATSMPREG